MKKQLVLSVFLFFGWMAKAQNIPNPSFDSVYFGGIDRLFEWITADGFRMAAGTNWPDTINGLAPDSTYAGGGFAFHELVWLNNQMDTSPHSDLAAVIMNRPNWYKTNGEIFGGFLIAGNSLTTDNSGYPDLSRCGIAFAHRPTKLHGQYHFVDSTLLLNNFGKCIILLSKWNATNQQRDTIAFAETTTELSPTAGFTPFELALNYRSAAVPDTIMVAFFAGTVLQNPSALWLDELSFGYSGFGLPEVETVQTLAYPNPTRDGLHINAQATDRVQLFDASGRLLYSGIGTQELNLSRFTAQLFILSTTDAHGRTQTQRIIKLP
jgi:hypothetical protein